MRTKLCAKCMACFMVFILLIGQCTACSPQDRASFSAQPPDTTFVVVDAGHGGVDGGAVSRNGQITESQLNLQVTRRLALLLLFCGQQVMLTRPDENDLASADAATVREKKVSDLKNRVAVINSVGVAAMISIHQNSLPSHPGVHGAQVFYNTAVSSSEMAASTQSALNQLVNPGNEKTCKAIDGGIYLMKEVTCPAILVECGFLSNDAEAALLCREEHQIQLALAIAAGYLQYRNERIA